MFCNFFDEKDLPIFNVQQQQHVFNMEPQIDLLETKLRQSLNGRHFGDKSKMKAEIKKVFAQYDTS